VTITPTEIIRSARESAEEHDIQLSEHQMAAVVLAAEWYFNSAEQVFRLFGSAGTGKTTIAKVIVSTIKRLDEDLEWVAVAPTGRAAVNLTLKGLLASTIHRALYTPIDPNEDTSRLPLSERLDMIIRGEIKASDIIWSLKENNAVACADLVVLDEASMVGGDVGRDLVSCAKKIIVIGDPYQLPPVGGPPTFSPKNPDVMLKEVFRQADGSPILDVADHLRRGLPAAAIPTGNGISLVRGSDLKLADIAGSDMIICGKNKTRVDMTRWRRRLSGVPVQQPIPGDRVICLSNDWSPVQTCNGEIATVVSAKSTTVSGDRYFEITLDRASEPKTTFLAPELLFAVEDSRMHDNRALGAVIGHTSGRRRGQIDRNSPKWTDYPAFSSWTFADVVTCHKCQGGEWGKVVVVDEGSVFREDSAKWRYTAATRAKSELVWIT